MMALGKFDGDLESFRMGQEDAWERTAQIVAMIHNTTRNKAEQCKDPDDFNLWLAVKGNETVSAEEERKKREVIAERKREQAAARASDGGQQSEH